MQPPAPRAALAAAAARLDRLRLKLFLAIAGANALLALAAYFFFTWSFDRGMVESLQRRDAARLDSFIAALAEEHGRAGSWQFMTAERWTAASRSALGLPPVSRREAAARGEPPPPAPREPPPTVDFRLLLLDADRRLLFGPADRAGAALLKPIVSRDRTAGYLGYVPRTGLAESFERAVAARQHWLFGAVALGMLAAALLLGAGLAHWLTRRIRAVAAGTAQLIEGNYGARVADAGHDEIAQLARHFNELAQTLSATQRARQQWVADIAHELRTPLAVLRGEIEALQDGVRRFDSETLDSLAQEVSRLGRLVEDLHLLAQTDVGGLTYRKETLDLGELVEEAVNAQRRALDERGIRPDLDIAPGVHVTADATRLAQVLANLLQNTLRYTDSPGRLRLRLREVGGRAILEWQDSSPGVSDDDLPRLTDRLYRVDASRQRMGADGAGLGLAIARAIVEAHGGTITAGHSPLGGLDWTMTFPIAHG